MTNPNRPLASILRSFSAVNPGERKALTERGTRLPRPRFRGRPRRRPSTLRRYHAQPPRVQLAKGPLGRGLALPAAPASRPLVESDQGKTHDGGISTTRLTTPPSKSGPFEARDILWTWGPDLLKYNPPALLYQGVAGAAEPGQRPRSTPLKEVANWPKS